MMTLDDTRISNILFHPRKEEWGYTPAGIPTVTPLSEARALIDACGNSGKKLVEIEGAGHNDLMFRSGMIYWESICLMTGSLSG